MSLIRYLKAYLCISCIISCSLKVAASFCAISALFFDTLLLAALMTSAVPLNVVVVPPNAFFCQGYEMTAEDGLEFPFLRLRGRARGCDLCLSSIEETELAGRVLQTDKHRLSRDLEHGGL